MDGAAELLNLAAGDIEGASDFGQALAMPHFGMAEIKGKVKILLDINQVLTSRELHGVDALVP